jgi:hypothetical protein
MGFEYSAFRAGKYRCEGCGKILHTPDDRFKGDEEVNAHKIVHGLVINVTPVDFDVDMLGDLIGDKDTARNMISLAYYCKGTWVVTSEEGKSHSQTAGVYWDGTDLIHGRDV